MKWYLAVLKKYAVFSGRARREEYWMFQLVNILLLSIYGFMIAIVTSVVQHSATAAALLTEAAADAEDFGLDVAALLGLELLIPIFFYCVAIFIPLIAVSVRRLHDTGRSGWWYLINFIPGLGSLIFFIFTVFDSQPSENQYGPNPKG
jgi:uncharacterized membrane protein YhaH (DUF805 family)